MLSIKTGAMRLAAALLPLCCVVIACGQGQESPGPGEVPAAAPPDPVRGATKSVPARRKGVASDPASSECDSAALHREAAELARHRGGWSGGDGILPVGGQQAASAVWRSCPDLPPTLQRFIDAAVVHPVPDHVGKGHPAPAVVIDPLAQAFPGHEASHPPSGRPPAVEAEDERAWAELTEALCPSIPAIMKEQSGASRANVAAAVYAGCKLSDRLPMGRGAFARMPTAMSIVRVLALLEWVATHGGDRADTTRLLPLMDLVSLELEAGRSLPPTFRIPVATKVRPPAVPADARVIRVGPDSIYAFDKELDALAAGQPPEGTVVEGVYRPLFDELVLQREQDAAIAARVGGAETPGAVVLAVHSAVAWPTAELIFVTARKAGFEQIGLLVLVDEVERPLRWVPLVSAASRERLEKIAPDSTVQRAITVLGMP